MPCGSDTEVKRELEYFYVDGRFGGRQAWFWDPALRLAGCAALAACDSCISMAPSCPELCPFDARALDRRHYMSFVHRMKSYLRPRLGGIDSLELFVEGLGRYFHDVGAGNIRMDRLPGDRCLEAAERAVRGQIDGGLAVPFLMLRHKDKKEMDDYIWHWFMLTGYEDREDGLWVKATTYGEWHWKKLARLWDTGHDRKGGLILYRVNA